jgi:XRE family aerobic/anaerobic benzoate catabolism transcriptional regulator
MTKHRHAPAEQEADAEGHPFLDALADRVRMVRSGRGMSRKALARAAHVSERYLAQLEAGKGNISILLLRRVARAMGVPLTQLVDERRGRPVDAALLDRFIDRLAPTELAEARALLHSRFAPPLARNRDQRIALIGLRGAGKSTIGAELARELGAPFIELDREIEALAGMALSELIEMFGQERFRRSEYAALETVLSRHERFVLATGGSLVTEPATFDLLLTACRTVWVRAKPAQHMDRVIAQGDLRPMADNARAMDDLVAILESREPLYAKADVTIDTADRSEAESVAELLRLLV